MNSLNLHLRLRTCEFEKYTPVQNLHKSCLEILSLPFVESNHNLCATKRNTNIFLRNSNLGTEHTH